MNNLKSNIPFVLITSGFASLENIMGYLEHKPKFVKKGRGVRFQKALEECENYMVCNNVSENNFTHSNICVF